MSVVGAIILLLWLHFFCDFVMQTDRMAINKSKSNRWLLFHVAVYSTPFLLFGVRFGIFNFFAHLITDWISSRLSSYFWNKGERHWFFVVIGADQAVHMTCLILSAWVFQVWQ